VESLSKKRVVIGMKNADITSPQEQPSIADKRVISS
jgi:hypothetical protein